MYVQLNVQLMQGNAHMLASLGTFGILPQQIIPASNQAIATFSCCADIGTIFAEALDLLIGMIAVKAFISYSIIN